MSAYIVQGVVGRVGGNFTAREEDSWCLQSGIQNNIDP